MPEKFIYYEFGSVKRKITILNGQPYYQSLGLNGLMLPFICCKGLLFQPVFDPELPVREQKLVIPEHLNAAQISALFLYKYSRRLLPFLLISADKDTLSPGVIDVDVAGIDRVIARKFVTPDLSGENSEHARGILVRRKYLLDSIRLSLALLAEDNDSLNELMNAGRFSPEERRQALEPVLLESDAEFVTDNPDRVNLWLLENGAEDIKSLVCQNRSLREVLAAYASHPLINVMKRFVPAYTRNLFAPFEDDRIQATGLAWLKLYDGTLKLASERIQLGSPPQRVKKRTIELVNEMEQFVDTVIGENLDDDKTQRLVSRLQELTPAISGESPADQRRTRIRR